MSEFAQKWSLLATTVFALIVVSILVNVKPLMPIDETRYLSVAWEMWNSGDWLVPHKNGLPYDHKPPMLFWLINMYWAVAGTEGDAVRYLLPWLSVLNLLLVAKLAQGFYPQQSQVAVYSPLVLFCFPAWLLFSSMTMFDTLITLFVLLHVQSLWRYAKDGELSAGLIAALAIGLGILSKGPVMLVYCLPVLLLMRYWWTIGVMVLNYRRVLIAAGWMYLAGLCLALCWAIPAGIAGGPDYAQAIFFGQSVNRMYNSFAHARPFYWYLLLLPVLLLPWSLSRNFWRNLRQSPITAADRFFLGWFLAVLLIFSVISGKQIHYLLPVLPAAALVVANRIAVKPLGAEPWLMLLLLCLALGLVFSQWWLSALVGHAGTVTLHRMYLLPLLPVIVLLCVPHISGYLARSIKITVPAAAVMALLASVSPLLFTLYSVEPVAQKIAWLQQRGHQVSFFGEYHNTFAFSGRLQQPLIERRLAPEQDQAYLQQASQGFSVLTLKQPDPVLAAQSLTFQPYRGSYLYLVPNSALITQTDLVSR